METYPSWLLANFSFLPDFEYMVSILLGLSNSDKWQQDSENPNYAHWPKCNGMEWRRGASQRQAGWSSKVTAAGTHVWYWQTNSPFRLCFVPCSSGLNSRKFCLVWHACRHYAGKLLKSDLKLQPEPSHCGSILFEYVMKRSLYKSTPKPSIRLKRWTKENTFHKMTWKNSSGVLKSKRKRWLKPTH